MDVDFSVFVCDLGMCVFVCACVRGGVSMGGGGLIPPKQDEEIHFTWRVLREDLNVCGVITLRAVH